MLLGVAIAVTESPGIAISVNHKDMSVKEMDFTYLTLSPPAPPSSSSSLFDWVSFLPCSDCAEAVSG